MDKDKKSEIHITNNFNAPIGQHIDHVDTINFRMDGEGNFHFGMVENVKKERPCDERDDAEQADDTPSDEELVAKLKPIFYNKEEEVWQFLKEIRGMAPPDITDLVNRWVKDKRISSYGNSRKGWLWGLLHDAGLYLRSNKNWNERVK
ncbi:MAG: hypothetical protein K6A32_07495 [Bacteroidales bacterium]|nr:hypothetical protein [Bacteroidales bacterium]